jgi:hypothetical protein
MQCEYADLKCSIGAQLDNQITGMIKIFRKKVPVISGSKLATIQEQSP